MIQLLIIDNIGLSTYVNPFIYIVFIITLPFSMRPWLVLIISFATGMIIDSFGNTPGLHMAACTLIGYFRGFYLKFAASKEDFSGISRPTLSAKGPFWFILYAMMMVFIHHFALFYLEIYGFQEFFHTFLRVVSSTFFSLMLIVLGQLIFYDTADKRRSAS